MPKYEIKDYVPDLPVDYAKHTNGTAYCGLYRQKVSVNGEERTVVSYIPDDYFPYHKGAFILIPAGISMEDFIERSGWVACAKKNSICLIFLSPDGKWGTPEKEAPFIEKAYSQVFHSAGVISFDQKYAIGYGDSADFLARYLCQDSHMMAGAVLFGPADLPKSVVKKAEDTRRLPVWIIHEKDQETPVLTDYFIRRNLCTDEGLRNAYARVYQERMLPVDEDQTTQAVSRVWVSGVKNAASLYRNLTWTERVYMDFLIKRYHHDNLSTTQLKVNYSLEEIGVKVFRKRMKHASFDAPQERIWSVYAPTDYDKNKAYPMVVVTHGFECTHELMIKSTDFWKIAEKRKFIAVFTQALPTDGSNYGLPRWRSDGLCPKRNFQMSREPDSREAFQSEISYFRTVVEDVRKHYSIDPARIYCTGHSNGSVMTYALSMEMGDVFAASAQVGASCWQFDSLDAMPKNHYRMPALSLSCEYDKWTDPMDKESPLYWELLWRKVENGVDPDAEPFILDNGTVITYVWNNREGIPVVKFAMYRDSRHSYHSGIAWYVWDEFLSNYSRGEDGTRYYGGRPIR